MIGMSFQVDASVPIALNGEKLVFKINEYKPPLMGQFCTQRKTVQKCPCYFLTNDPTQHLDSCCGLLRIGTPPSTGGELA